MGFEDLMRIWPNDIVILCSSVEERKVVTEIALDAGVDGCISGYSESIMAGTANSDYMHPKSVWTGNHHAPYITYHATDRGSPETTITFDEFMRRVDEINAPLIFEESGDLDSLLA